MNLLIVKKTVIFSSVFLIMVSITLITPVHALQQVAGLIEVDVNPGETKSVSWQLVSDDSKPITVEIVANGPGSEFLSFPKTVKLEPHAIVPVEIKVSIPKDHSGDVSLRPAVYATQKGEKEGTTVVNVQMKKYVTINIAQSKVVEIDKEPTAKSENNEKGGGCLIATAAYGSELAPQVQFLREIRDNKVTMTESGVSFMTQFNKFYYSFSPTVADLERQNPLFKEAVKVTITPLLMSLSILNYVDVDSDAEMLGYGISLIMLNVGMYFVAPTFAIIKIKSKISARIAK